MMDKIGYIINVDVGHLEEKAILLLESIIKFVDNDPFVIVIKPNLKPISPNTLRYFTSKNVHFHEIELGNFFNYNMMMSKIFIASYAETLYGEMVDYLLFLDTDTIFLNSIENNLFNKNFLIALRPTDFSDGSLVSFDSCSSVWKYLIKKFNLEENVRWKHKCIRDNVIAYASFNSGFILERKGTHLFEKWKIMADSVQSDKNFIDLLNQDKDSFHYLDQILLSCILMKDFYPEDIDALNIRYNFNLESLFFGHVISFMGRKWVFDKLSLALDDLIHLHYHHAFDSNPKSILRYFHNKEYISLLKSFVPFNNNINFREKIYKLVSKMYAIFRFTQYYILYNLMHKQLK